MSERQRHSYVPSLRGTVAVASCAVCFSVATLISTEGWSQVGVPLPPRPPLPPELPAPVPPPQIVPPAPPTQPREGLLGAGVRVFVKEIRVIGNTAFTPEQLAEVTAPYTNRELTTEDFESLRLAVTLYYVNRGYVTSGALLPDQELKDGVVTVQVIEGKLAQIEIEGNKWFRKPYYTSRIKLGAETPLNIYHLQERLQLIQSDPRIERLNAELKPGLTQDQSILNVRVSEHQPFHLFFDVNNQQSPTVGETQGLVTGVDDNLFGWGDRLSLQYGRSSGVNPILNFRYDVPVTPWDTTVFAQYRKFTFAVKEAPFEELDIVNKAEIYSIGIRHPVYRSIDREFALTLVGEYETNESTLLNEPFDFVAGAQNGKFKIAPIRFGQEYIQRTQESVLSVLSRFSVGLGVLDATQTSNSRFADAQFFSWLGEGQYLRTFENLHRTQLFGRTLVQVTNSHLFPLEQMSVGGRYSVRGYREYSILSDNAFLASLEARVPVISTDRRGDIFYLVPFFDYGRAWNTNVANPSPDQWLASVGIGLIWHIWQGSRLEFYWGHQLNRLDLGDDSLQDLGMHFQLVVQAF